MDRTFDPSPDWRPTHAPDNARYVGNESCSQCHTEGATQPNTPMAQAMERVAERRLLMTHAQLTFKIFVRVARDSLSAAGINNT
jgi:hypothetical protein